MNDRQLYEQYAVKIHRFFSNKAAADGDIDDLMQTTFVRLFEKRKTEEILMPERYLYRIAHHVLLEYWRKRKRADMYDEIGTVSLADLGAGITTLMAADEEQQRILSALRTLRLDFQTVIELKYWERLTYNEIAELLDINPTTVGVWLKRGRRQLHKLLIDDEPAPEPDHDDEDERWPGETSWEDANEQDDPDRDSGSGLSELMEQARRATDDSDDEVEEVG